MVYKVVLIGKVFSKVFVKKNQDFSLADFQRLSKQDRVTHNFED
jgi:hypothetical protein